MLKPGNIDQVGMIFSIDLIVFKGLGLKKGHWFSNALSY